MTRDSTHGTFLLRVSLLIVVCLLSACISGNRVSDKITFQHSYSPDKQPEFWLEYHPYPPDQLETLQPRVRAIPYFDGWTDLRMERDLLRISAAGFSTILLYITPETMASKVFAERLQKFHQLAGTLPVPPAIALVISSQAKDFTLSLPNTMNFFNSRGFSKLPHALQVKQNPILFFSEQVQLIDEYYGLERHAYINDFLPPVEIFHERSTKPGCRVRAAAPLGGENQMTAYRQNGMFFAKQLQRAFDHKAPIICISSWNNYQNASFIEPNSLDQNRMLEILQMARQQISK
ncbi:MAG: hypothetical protein GX927_09275 [Lentisphaerae bacterium]|jgi:hypothetical protein|nr:hypothetical protein [Lentisphaerota bacterium]